MNRSLACAVLALSYCAVSALPAPAAPDLDPRTRQNVAAIERMLPECEKAADACEKALEPFRDAKDAHVRAAFDGALLRIAAVRSVRTIIATEPGYLAYHLGEPALRQWREGMDHFLACARSGTDPYQGATSGVRTCRSRIDGQILFYVFRLPRDYTPARRYPLDVDLHCGAALTWRAGWIDGKPSADPARAGREERIWVSPCGRGNNCYAGMGEVAVLEALRDVKRHYAVDEDRVTVGGASMGGTGGFRLGGFHPDLFAAAHSLTGWPNYSVPVNHGRFDPTLLLDNLCNTGLCLWYEPGDWKSDANLAYMKGLPERARRYPGFYPHLILTDPKGGHGIIDRNLQEQGWDWIRKQKRDPYPKRVIYKTYSLRYPGAYWAYLDTVEDAGAPARIEAELDEAGKLRVAVENADRFHLNLVKELVGDARELAVTVNGGAPLPTPAGRTAYFAKTDGRWALAAARYPAGLVKKHGVSGPVQDVFMGGPVLMVHGTRETRDRAKAERMIDGAVLRLFGPGDGSVLLHTPFERKADRDVEDRDIADKHLVLFGTPRQNLLVGRIAGKLPVKFLEDGVEIAGKEYRGPDVGLVMVYPNPLNPERYVLLLPENYGTYTALGYSTIYTFPDYVVGKPVAGYGGLTMQVLTQGTFDARWSAGSRVSGDDVRRDGLRKD